MPMFAPQLQRRVERFKDLKDLRLGPMRPGYPLLVLDLDRTIFNETVLRPGTHEFLAAAYKVIIATSF